MSRFIPGQIRSIQIAVLAEYPPFTLSDLFAHCRSHPIVHARQIAIYLAKEMTGRSTYEIGQSFRREHATVIHACHRIGSLVKVNPEIAARVDRIRKMALEAA